MLIVPFEMDVAQPRPDQPLDQPDAGTSNPGPEKEMTT